MFSKRTGLLLASVLWFALASAAWAVNAPVITPATSVISTALPNISISADAGTTIHFTTDGSDPNSGSPTYTVPFAMPSNVVVVKAIAIMGVDQSPVSVSYLQFDLNASLVPRTGLKLWLKADFGPVTGGGAAISRWVDLSNSVNDASQSNSSNQPILQSSSVNGLPGATFNGTSQYLNLASGFADLTTGIGCFLVVRPKSSGTGRILVSGNTGPTDMVDVQTNGSLAKFECYNGTTSSILTSASGAVTVNKYQLLEALQNGSGAGTIYVNGKVVAQGSLQTLLNTTRSLNHIASNLNASAFWQGEIAEALVYARNLTSAERSAVEAYLGWRYQLMTATVAAAPIISVPAGTLSGPTQVAIAARGNSTVYVTQDGTDPDPATSPTYDRPLNVSYSQTLKTIAVSNGVQSTISSASYSLDPSKWPAPSPTDPTNLQVDLDLPTTTQ